MPRKAINSLRTSLSNFAKSIGPFIREAWHSNALRGLMSALNWQLGAKLVTFLAGVYAARCLGPRNLGDSGIILTSVAQVSLLITLGQDTLLIREFKSLSSKSATRSLAAIYASNRLLMTCLIMVILGVILAVVGIPPSFVEGIILGFVIAGLNANSVGWLLVAKDKAALNYRATAISALISGLIVLVFFQPGQRVFSDLYVAAVGALVLLCLTWSSASFNPLRHFSLQNALSGLRFLWRARWIAMTAIVVYIYTQIDQPLLGYLYSLEELGKYRTATSLCISLNLAFATLPVFYYPRMIEWKNRGMYYFRKRIVILSFLFAVVGIIATVIMFVVSPLFYPSLYGTEFSSAAYPFAILFASKMVVLVSGPFAWGLWSFGQDKLMLVFLCLAATVALTIGVLLIPHFGMFAAASANLAAEVVVLIACCIAFMRISHNFRGG